MRLTCNKKAYPQFQEVCNKCSMKIECIDNDKSVFMGIIEPSSVNITVNFNGDNGGDINEKVDMERISKALENAVKCATRCI